MTATLDNPTNLDSAEGEDGMKSDEQESAEKLAVEASENVRLAKKIMENMARRKRAIAPVPPLVAYERR
jgi:hypothetical protein